MQSCCVCLHRIAARDISEWKQNTWSKNLRIIVAWLFFTQWQQQKSLKQECARSAQFLWKQNSDHLRQRAPHLTPRTAAANEFWRKPEIRLVRAFHWTVSNPDCEHPNHKEECVILNAFKWHLMKNHPCHKKIPSSRLKETLAPQKSYRWPLVVLI